MIEDKEEVKRESVAGGYKVGGSRDGERGWEDEKNWWVSERDLTRSDSKGFDLNQCDQTKTP